MLASGWAGRWTPLLPPELCEESRCSLSDVSFSLLDSVDPPEIGCAVLLAAGAVELASSGSIVAVFVAMGSDVTAASSNVCVFALLPTRFGSCGAVLPSVSGAPGCSI